MKKLFVLAFVLASTVASASCPTYQPYRCVQGFNGKMICGCGV